MPTPRTRDQTLPLVALLAMTAAWGSTFFLLHDVVTRIPVPDLLAVRFAVASVGLALIAGRQLRMTRRTVRDGVLLGALYGSAQILQTAGLTHTSASVSGFITGLYVVLTPLLAALVLRTRIAPPVWLGVVLATAGLGVLSLGGFDPAGGSANGYGELLTLASAVIYAGHIIALGRFSTPGSALSLSLVQMVTITVLCTGSALWPTAGSGVGLRLPQTAYDWGVVLFLGLVAGALTMVLQTWAQARIEASRAAVVMAMEPVWAAAFAVALGGERVTLRMLVGGLAILAAMYVVELAPRRPGSGLSDDQPVRDGREPSGGRPHQPPARTGPRRPGR